VQDFKNKNINAKTFPPSKKSKIYIFNKIEIFAFVKADEKTIYKIFGIPILKITP
jgi:hypothetical protein